MGRHDDIASDIAARGFQWPELPNVPTGPATAVETRRGRIMLDAGALHIATLPYAPDLAEPLAFAVTMGDWQFVVGAEPALAALILGKMGVDQSPEALTPATLAIVIEHVLAPLVLNAGLSLEDDLTVCPAAHAIDLVDDPAAVGFRVEGDEPTMIRVQATPEMLERLVDLLPEAKEAPKVADLSATPLTTCLQTPGFEMAADAFAAFEMGDVILLDPRWVAARPAHLTIQGISFAATRRTDRGHVVTRVERAASLKDQETSMTQTAEKTRPAPPAQAPVQAPNAINDTLSELTVTLAVELDRTEMPLGTIGKLTEGAVLPFEREVPGPVNLTANGKIFATGELVQTGDRIGVRILSLV